MFKRMLPFISLLVLGLLLAACGNTTTTTSSSTPTATTAPAATATTAPSAVVQTASATVQGKSVTILTDSKGMTLYYFTPDTATTSACTGGCASAWPPLLFTGSGTPSSSGSLSGTLTAANAGNGNQVEYNGHLLYTYSGDSAAGQTNGEGASGKWFVATSDLATGSASSGSGSGSSSAVVKTASATVQGKSATILTDAKGMTLYYFTPDTATTSACTGGCASAWPPLLFTGSGTPASSGSLSGKLTAASAGNGNQVEYNGHLLYTYSGDSAAGQTNGEGASGKWFVATSDLTPLTASSGTGY